MGVKVTDLGNALFQQTSGIGRDWSRPIPVPPSAPAMPQPIDYYGLTWDSYSSNYHSLSENKRIATATANGWTSLRTVGGVSSGKYYFEITADNNAMFGIATSDTEVDAQNMSNKPGAWVFETRTGDSAGMYKHHNGNSELYGSRTTDTVQTWGIAVDFNLGLIWLRNSDGSWNGNPVNSTGPAFAFAGTSPFYIVGSTFNITTTLGINTGADAFVYDIPGGYNTTAPDPSVAKLRQENDNTGFAVAVNEQWGVVGSPYQDWDITGTITVAGSGAVFVYRRGESNWDYITKLTPPEGHTRAENAFFGYAVAIVENQIFVSAPGHKTILDDSSTTNSAGAVFVFEYNQDTEEWEYKQLVTPMGADSRKTGDQFGTALSAKDSILVVGAQQADWASNSDTGAAWIFAKNETGIWEQVQYLYADGNTRNAQDRFGTSLAVDGSWMVVTATGHGYDINGRNLVDGAGAAYLFERINNIWTYKQKITSATRIAGENWGETVCIKNNLLVIGNPSSNNLFGVGAGIYSQIGYITVFLKDANNVWNYIDTVQPNKSEWRDTLRFGSNIIIDGERIYVFSGSETTDNNGTNSIIDAGAVWVFKYNATGYTKNLNNYKLISSGSGIFSATATPILNVLVVGGGASGTPASGAGGNGGGGGGSGRVKTTTFTPQIGESFPIAVGAAGTVITTNPNYGTNGGTSTFGTIVADGGTCAGTLNNKNGGNGAVAGGPHIFGSIGGTPGISYGRDDISFFSQFEVTPGENVGTGGNYGGAGININGSGNWGAGGNGGAVGGSTAVNGRSGLVYFEYFASVISYFEQETKLTGNILTTGRFVNQRFGHSISVVDNIMLVGVPGDTTDSENNNNVSGAGAAYLLERDINGIWSVVQKITSDTGLSSRNPYDGLGSSIHCDGTTLVVGATGHVYDSNQRNFKTNAGAVYIWNWDGYNWIFKQKITPVENQRNAADRFGLRVAVDGTKMVVSSTAHQTNSAGTNALINAGAVWIFEYENNTWVQKQKITPTGTNARITNDYFGDIIKLQGDKLVVGVKEQDYDANGANLLAGSGTVFVYERNISGVWEQTARICAPTRNAGDNFGCSIDVLDDVLIIGGLNHSTDMDDKNTLSQAGAAWLYKKIDGLWTYQQKITGWGHDRNASDRIGGAVSISGNLLLVGAPGHSYNAGGRNWIDRAGAVYAYVWDSGWQFRQKITPTDAQRQTLGRFGFSVSIDGNIMVVGAPGEDWATMPADTQENHLGRGAVYMFERVNGVWNQIQRLTPSGTNAHYNNASLPTTTGIPYWRQPAFGWTVAVNSNIAVVGQPWSCWDQDGLNQRFYSGAAYTFVRNTTTGIWAQEARLTANQMLSGDRANLDIFGYSVDTKNNMVIVGAAWQDLDQNGNNLMTDAGAAYVWRRELDGLGGFQWTAEQKLTGFALGRNANDRFGEFIAAEGEWVFIGSPGNQFDENGNNYRSEGGAVYVYRWTNQQWSFYQKLAPSGINARNTNDRFGRYIAINGIHAVISAPQHSFDATGGSSITNAGAVWVYEFTEIGWLQTQKIVATGTNGRQANSYFGSSVAINGTTLAVGAPYATFDSTGGNSIANAGAVWVFVKSGGTWNIQSRITPPVRSSENFGFSLAVRDNWLIVGGPNNSTDNSNTTTKYSNQNTNAGAVWAYYRSGSTWTFTQKLIGWGHDRNTTDLLGWSVSANNNLLAVSAIGHTYNQDGNNYLNDAGAVYIWSWENNNWVFEQKITPTLMGSRGVDDRFGHVVSMGVNILAVGVPRHKLDGNASNSLTDAGAVMMFSRDPAQPIGKRWTHSAKLVPSIRYAGDLFGNSICLDGNIIVIGSPGVQRDSNEVNPLSNAGAVYVFERIGSTWSQMQKITPTGTNARLANDTFGWSVSIHGNVMVVGAPGQDYDESGTNIATDSGAVWIYKKISGSWVQSQKIAAEDRARSAYDYFGSSVSGEGIYLAVGAPNHDYDDGYDTITGQLIERNYTADAGAVYVWYWNGSAWVFEQKITGLHREANDLYGSVVCLRGSTLAVGAPQHKLDSSGSSSISNAGAVYVYQRSGVGLYPWELKNKLVPTGRTNNDYFGSSISMHGNWLAVGAPGDGTSLPGKVGIFQRIDGLWQPNTILTSSGTNANMAGDQFGFSVSLKEHILVVGSPQQDWDQNGNLNVSNAGAAWVFTRSGTVWSQSQKLVSWGHDRNSGDRFTFRMDAHNGTMVVSAPYHDYDQDGNNYVSNAGAIYTWLWNNNTWTLEQKIIPEGFNSRNADDNFGYNLAINGNLLAVTSITHQYDSNGSNPILNAGAVWVYERTPGNPGTNVWTQTAKITPTGTNARNSNDQFGFSIAVDDLTSTIIVGANRHSYGDIVDDTVAVDAGAVWVYKKISGSWTQSQKIIAGSQHRGHTTINQRIAGDNFGWSVSYHDNMLIVGAPNHDYDATGEKLISNAGAAYVYVRNTSSDNFTQIQKIAAANQTKNNNDLFGYSLSSDGSTMFVGAPYHGYDSDNDFFMQDAGAVFVWGYENSTWVFKQKLTPANGNASNDRKPGDLFGWSLWLEGNYAVISSPKNSYNANASDMVENAGAVFVYERNTTTGIWERTAKLVADNRVAFDEFGRSVVVNGTTIAVGTPLHDWNSDNTTQQANAGAVWVYTLDGSIWTLQQKITPIGDWINGDAFGTSIALNGDILVVGAPNNTFDQWGNNSTTGAGAVFVYSRSGGVWTQQDKVVATTITREAGDNFSTGLAGDDTWLLVGSPNHDWDQDERNKLNDSGAVWAFSWNSGTNTWTQTQKITPTGTNSRHPTDLFGSTIALDGNWAVISAPQHDYDSTGGNALADAGAVWIYKLVGGVWTQHQKISAPLDDRGLNNRFGTAIDIKDDIIIIGSPYHDRDVSGLNSLSEAGAVWVYRYNGTNDVWNFKQKLVPTGTNARNTGDHFGSSVTVDANHAYVGSPDYSWDHNGNNTLAGTGAVWMFTRPGSPSVTLYGGNPTTPATVSYVYDQDLDTITSITLVNNGDGYTQHPEVLFVPNTETSDALAWLNPTSVANLTIVNPGYGWTDTPTVTIINDPLDTTGSGATAVATIAPIGVAKVVLSSLGSGYTDIPTVTFTGGDGSGVSATAILADTSIATVNVLDRGSNYTSIPNATFIGTGSTTSKVHMELSTVEIVSAGTQFNIDDTVTISSDTTNAIVRITSVDSNGAATGVEILHRGDFTILPGTTSVAGNRVMETDNYGNITDGATTTDSYGNITDLSDTDEDWGGITPITFNLTYRIHSVEILTSGGYRQAATATIGGNAQIQPVLTPTTLSRVIISNTGSNYTVAPTVEFTGGGATIQAVGTAELSPSTLGSITLTNSGSGYTRTPIVQLTGNGHDTIIRVDLAPTNVATIQLNNGGTDYQAWSQRQKLTSYVFDRREEDHYGSAIAYHNNNLVVAAPDVDSTNDSNTIVENTGAVFAYRKNTDIAREVNTLFSGFDTWVDGSSVVPNIVSGGRHFSVSQWVRFDQNDNKTMHSLFAFARPDPVLTLDPVNDVTFNTASYSYIGNANQTFRVPYDIYGPMTLIGYGAGGGSAGAQPNPSAAGQSGSMNTTSFSVIPGEDLIIQVPQGGRGGSFGASTSSGVPGGAGGAGGWPCGSSGQNGRTAVGPQLPATGGAGGGGGAVRLLRGGTVLASAGGGNGGIVPGVATGGAGCLWQSNRAGAAGGASVSGTSGNHGSNGYATVEYYTGQPQRQRPMHLVGIYKGRLFYTNLEMDLVQVSNETLADSNWYHIVTTFDRTNRVMRIYVNNVLKMTISNITIDRDIQVNDNFTIGSYWDDQQNNAVPKYFYKGHMYGIGVWRKILSTAEINTVYNGSPLDVPSELQAYWQADQITNNQWFDSSGGSRHATINNGIISSDISKWSTKQKIAPTVLEENDRFGYSVDVFNDWFAASSIHHQLDSSSQNRYNDSGAVWLYKRNSQTGVWGEQQKLTLPFQITRVDGTLFGYSVSISDTVLAVGIPGSNNGAVALYKRIDNSWNFDTLVIPDSLMVGSNAGYSVAVTEDWLVIGSPTAGNGRVDIYKNNNGFYEPVTTLLGQNTGDLFGTVVKLRNNTIFVSATQHSLDSTDSNLITNAGAVYVYDYNEDTHTWLLKQKLVSGIRAENAHWGEGIDFYSTRAVIGSSNNKQVEIFELVGDSWIIIDKFKQPEIIDQRTAILMHFEGENNSTTFIDEVANYTTELTFKSKTHLSGSAIDSTYTFNGNPSLNLSSSTYAVINTNNFETRFYDADLTLEWWEYPVVTPYGCTLMTIGGIDPFGNGEGGFVIGLSGNLLRISTGTNNWDIARDKTLGNPILGQWQHVAITRSGTTWRTFRAGVLQDTWNQSGSISISSLPIVLNNYRGNSSWEGGFAGFRVTIGHSRYNDGFTPPTQMFDIGLTNDEHWNKVSLLMPFNSLNNLVDTPLMFNTPTGIINTGAYLSSNASAFGKTSLYLSDRTRKLDISCGERGNISRQNFTIDATVLFEDSGASGIHNIITKEGSWTIRANRSSATATNAGTPEFVITAETGTFTITGAANSIPLKRWVHFALVGIGSNIFAYMDGVLQGSTLLSGPIAVNTNAITFGGFNNTGIKGYIGEFRMITGEAKYTGNFAPPVDAFRFKEMAETNVGRGKVFAIVGSNEFIAGLPNHSGINTTNTPWTREEISSTEFTNLNINQGGLFEQWKSDVDGWSAKDWHCQPGIEMRQKEGDKFGAALDTSTDKVFVGVPNYGHNNEYRYYMKDTGAVFVYMRDYTRSIFESKLTSVNRRMGGEFGFALSARGNNVAVTSPGWFISGMGYGLRETYQRSGSVWLSLFNTVGYGSAVTSAPTATYPRWGTKITNLNDNLFVYNNPEFNRTQTSPWPSLAGGSVETKTNLDLDRGTLSPVGTNIAARGSNNNFGSSVSLDNGWLVVGASNDPLDANQLNSLANAGAVYAYTWDVSKSRWIRRQKITSANRAANVFFGRTLHLRGNYLFAGSPGTTAQRMDIYEVTSGVWTSRYNWTGGSSTIVVAFAGSITNSGLVVYSNPYHDPTGFTNSGIVGSITRSGTTWSLHAQTVEIITDMNTRNANDQFGYSISLNRTNGLLAIGSPGHSFNNSGITTAAAAGSVYTFHNTPGYWVYDTRLVSSAIYANSRIGETVRVQDNLVAFSGPNAGNTNGGNFQLTRRNSVQNYTLMASGSYSTTTWNNTFFAKNIVFINSDFAVVSVDGIGVVNNSNVGIGNTTTCGGWRELKNISGTWVSNSGGTLQYPSTSPSTMWHHHNYLPAHTGGRWDQNAMDYLLSYSNGRNTNDNFGTSVVISDDLQYIAIGNLNHDYSMNGFLGATDVGAVMIYWWDSTRNQWRYQHKITQTDSTIANTRLGSTLDFVGNRLVTGAYLHSTNSNARGLIQVYSKTGTGIATSWSVDYTYQGTQNSGERAGNSVTLLSSDLLVAGAPRWDTTLTDSGAALTWKHNGTTWNIINPLIPVGAINGRQNSDNFGYSVSAYGNKITVGTPKHSYNVDGLVGTNQMGCAWVYVDNGSTYRKEQKLIPQTYVTSNQQFGYSVHMRDNIIAVGGPYGSSNFGAAYICEYQDNNWTQTHVQSLANTNDYLGTTVCVDNNNQVIIGVPYNDGTNATQVTDSGAWLYVRKVDNAWKSSIYYSTPGYNSYSITPTDLSKDPNLQRTFVDEKFGGQVLNINTNVYRSTENARIPGRSSAKFDGRNAQTALSRAYASWMAFGAGSFCVEARVRFDTTSGTTHQHIVGRWNANAGVGASWIMALIADGALRFYNNAWIDFAFVPSPGVWYHLAVSRDGNTWRLFVNGVLTNSVVSSITISNNTSMGLTIGNDITYVMPFYGLIEEVRITTGHHRYSENFNSDFTIEADGSNDPYWSFTSFVMTGRSLGGMGLTYGRMASDQFGYAVSIYDNKLYIGVPGREQNLDGSTRPSNNGAIQVYALNTSINRWYYHGGILNPDSSLTNTGFGYVIDTKANRTIVGAPTTNSRGAFYMFNEATSGIWTVERSEQIENWAGGNAVALADETLAFYSQHNNPGNPSLTNSGQIVAIRFNTLFSTWSSVDVSDGGYGKYNAATGTFGGNGGGGGGYPGGAGGGQFIRNQSSVQTVGSVGHGGDGGQARIPTINGSAINGNGRFPGNIDGSLRGNAGEGGQNGNAGTDGKIVIKWYSGTQYQEFVYTGADQNFIVPIGATNLDVELWGAGGSSGQLGSGTGICPPGNGGGGQYVTGTISVTPGEILTIMVGQGGRATTNPQEMYTTTYGGGAQGGNATYVGGEGGGRSAIIRSGVQLAVAGGGGGGAGSGNNGGTTPTTAHGKGGGIGNTTDGGTFISTKGLSNVRFAGDNIGYSVALGTNMAYLGAPGHEYNLGGQSIPTNAGVVFMFKRDPFTYEWSLVNKILSNNPTANMYFGGSILVRNNKIAIGTTTSNGRVEIKSLSNNNYTHESTITGTATAPFISGWHQTGPWNMSIGFDANRLVAGTPSLSVFAQQGNLTNGGGWNTWTSTGDVWSIYAAGQTTAGLSYGRFAGDHFGTNVLLVNTNHVLVSAPDHQYSINGTNSATSRGALYHYIYDETTNSWNYRNKITDTATANTKLGLNGMLIKNKRVFSLGNTQTYVYDHGDIDFVKHSQFVHPTTMLAIRNDNNIMFGQPTVSTTTTGQPTVTEAGIVSPYDYTVSWVENTTTKLSVPGSSYGRNAADAFGSSVGFATNWLVVGAPGHEYSEGGISRTSNTGAIYFYNRNIETGKYDFSKKIVSSLNTSNNIGSWISIQGNMIATGNTAYNSNSGYVEIYERSTTNIIATNTLQGSTGAYLGRNFTWDGSTKFLIGETTGSGIACNANALTNSGHVLQYSRTGTATWEQNATYCIGGSTNARNAGDQFAYSIDYNGTYLIVGAPNHDYDNNGFNSISNAGAVWIYAKETNNTFRFVGKFISDERIVNNRYGASVSISQNSQYVVIGAPGSNRAKFYTFDGKNLTLKNTLYATSPNDLSDQFGFVVRVRDLRIAVGAPGHRYDVNGENPLSGSGAVFVYQINTITGEASFREKLTTFTLDVVNPTSTTGPNGRNAGDSFGFSLDINNLNDIIVGAPYFDWNPYGQLFVSNAGGIWFKTLR
jgi:hypothetical protein